MGSWGAGIWDADNTCDTRDIWRTAMQEGADKAGCRQAVLDWMNNFALQGVHLHDPSHRAQYFFGPSWMALGALCVDHDVLTPEIQEHALRAIEMEDMESWRITIRGARAQALGALWSRLQATPV